MPEPATPVLPPRPHIMPTKAEPFDLETKKRGQDYVAKFNEKVNLICSTGRSLHYIET